MSMQLTHLMDDFARHTGARRFTVPDDGHVVLRVDGRVDVNILFDAGAHRVHLFSVAGAQAAALESATAGHAAIDAAHWSALEYQVDELDWAYRWRPGAGWLMCCVSAELSRLDAPRLGEMIDGLVERVSTVDDASSAPATAGAGLGVHEQPMLEPVSLA